MFNLDPSGLGCFFAFLFSGKENNSKILCYHFTLLRSKGAAGPACWRAERKTALILIGNNLTSDHSSSSRVLATKDTKLRRKERVSGRMKKWPLLENGLLQPLLASTWTLETWVNNVPGFQIKPKPYILDFPSGPNFKRSFSVLNHEFRVIG